MHDYLCFDVLFVLFGTYISWLLCAYCYIRLFVYYKYLHVLTSSVLQSFLLITVCIMVAMSFLRKASVTELTYKRYERAYERFYVWLGRRGVKVEELDELLLQYFEEIFEENNGSGKSVGKLAMAALVFFVPESKTALGLARQAMKGWDRLTPSQAYPPLDRRTNCLIAYWLILHHKFDFGVAVLLAFECFLRISEVVNIRMEHFMFDGDSNLPEGFAYSAVVRLEKTKTGDEQSCFVSKKFDWISKLIVRLFKKNKCLFPFSAADLRREFSRGVAGLGLEGRGYVFHSNRHGRATEEDLKGTSLEDILKMGRWAVAKSGRHYIQSGKAVLAKYKLPESLNKIVKRIEVDPLNVFCDFI
jgi:integrase